jgi:lysozyme
MTITPPRAPQRTVQPGRAPATKRGAFASAAILVIAVGSYIAPWEGKRNTSYNDIVGIGTVCYGDTRPEVVARGWTIPYTDAECMAMLNDEVKHFAAGLERCISPSVTMTPKQQAALLSWSYNVGTKAACDSTLVRKLNAGEPASSWCPQLLRWNRAGGKPVQGLTNRREAEYAACMEGAN